MSHHSGAGGSGFTPGGAARIPFGNAGGTALTDSAGFTWTAASHTLQGQSSNATLQINDSVGTVLRYTANQTLTMDGSDMTLAASARVKIAGTRFEMSKGADVASASTITMSGGNTVSLTGVATCNHITTTNWQAGSRITWIAAAASTLAHNTGAPPGGTAPMLNSSGANIVAAANRAFSYIYDGANWIQD